MPTSDMPFERRFDGRSMVVRFSLPTAYLTWWCWAVYICPFLVIVVNQVVNKQNWKWPLWNYHFREINAFVRKISLYIIFIYIFISYYLSKSLQDFSISLLRSRKSTEIAIHSAGAFRPPARNKKEIKSKL